MAWTITNWATNPDWASVTNINDFIGAIRERQTALCETPLMSLKNAGDDVQLASLWNALQQWVEDYYDSAFVPSHDAGVKRATTYYDGSDAPSQYANLAAVFSAAGLSTSTWRRYTTHPDEGGSDLSGKMGAGDIIGPWIFEDLQKVLNVLIWTHDPGWLPYYDYSEYWGSGSDDTWALAKSAAESDWGSRAPVGLWGCAGTAGRYTGGYQAQAVRRKTKLKIDYDIGTGINRAIDWHVKPRKIDYWDVGWQYQIEQFDASGEVDASSNPLAENTWCRWHTDDPAADVARPTSGAYISANFDFPNWCPDPSTVGYPDDVCKGFAADDSWALIRWDVTGGFSYT